MASLLDYYSPDFIGPQTPLAPARSRFRAELSDPAMRDRISALTNAEVGNQGPQARQAFLESLVNRAYARGTPVGSQMSLYKMGGYYPGLGNPGSVTPEQRTGDADLISQVLSGSNVGNYATGNASGRVGFNGGPQTMAAGGERFGVEGPDRPVMTALSGGDLPDIPEAATPTAGQVPPGIPVPAGVPNQGGALDRIGQGINDNWQTILALSGGIASGGIGPGLTQAAQTAAYLSKAGDTNDIKNYRYAQSQGYKGSYQDWLGIQANLNRKSGLQPFYAQGPNGELQAFQLDDRGGITPVALPEGMKAAPPTYTVNTPTEVQIRNRAGGGLSTGGPGGNVVPKDVRGAAAEKELGTEQGKAVTALPAIESTTSRLLTRLDALEKHPGLEMATGFIAGKSPVALGPAARDAIARINEINSASWTQAVQDLRGMGALSDREGARIEEARSRLSARDVSTEDYKKALSDLRDGLKTGLINARKIAAGVMKPNPIGGSTATGDQGVQNDPLGIR